MSDVVTLTTGQSETIYGTFAGAGAYLGMQIGPTYTAWRNLQPDDQKRTLASARRYIDRHSWDPDTAGSFAVRDAIVDAESHPPFQWAQYELAALAATKPAVLSKIETGNNIKSVGGSGVPEVVNFSPTSVIDGSSPPLPDVAMQLIGSYLTSAEEVDLNYGQNGNCESRFDPQHELTVWRPK